MSEGMKSAEAKTRAAKIFNATRPKGAKPVTGAHEGAKGKRPGVKIKASSRKK
jgi:hypothetical protein